MEQNIQHIIIGSKKYDAAQQEAMYKYCYPQMFPVCMRYATSRDDAAVLYNEALLKVLQNINQYQYNGEFMGWVRRIVVNTCIDDCRKKVKYSIRPLEEQHMENVYVENNIENNISSANVMQWLQQLPKSTSLVFNLYALEGYKLDEIAEKLGITVGTVKWHVSEARKVLRELMKPITSKPAIENANSK